MSPEQIALLTPKVDKQSLLEIQQAIQAAIEAIFRRRKIGSQPIAQRALAKFLGIPKTKRKRPRVRNHRILLITNRIESGSRR